MTNIIIENPAAFIGVLRALAIAVMGLLVAFGLPITDDQKIAILDFTAAVVPVALLFSAASHKLTVKRDE